MKSDGELLSEFKHGDAAAFKRLVRRHHLSLYNFFYMLVNRHDLADDLTQDVFLRLHAAKDLLQLRTAFTIYLYRTGCACWADHLRRTAPAAALPAPADAVPTEQLADVEVLVRQLAYLPAELRLTLVLHETCGLSYRETAQVLEVAPEIVRRRVGEAYSLLMLQTRARQESAVRQLPAPGDK